MEIGVTNAKSSVQTPWCNSLHSVIRRRKGDETVFTIECGKYLTSRNKL